MSELRSMLIYGNCLDDADHGRGARAYASGNGPHAVYGAGAEGGILSGGKTADGSDFKRNKDIGHCHKGKLRKCNHGACGDLRINKCNDASSGDCA